MKYNAMISGKFVRWFSIAALSIAGCVLTVTGSYELGKEDGMRLVATISEELKPGICNELHNLLREKKQSEEKP